MSKPIFAALVYDGIRRVLLMGAPCAVGCLPSPSVPDGQLAKVQVESRAKVRTVDGRPLVALDEPSPEEFWIAPGCRVLSVYYEESYVLSNGGIFFFTMNPTLAPLAMAATAVSIAGAGPPGAVVQMYSTDVPIRFYVSAEPGGRYWVTSTFNGEEFQPRLVVLDDAGQRKAAIMPGQPCQASGP